jgi:hypothetical protein
MCFRTKAQRRLTLSHGAAIAPITRSRPCQRVPHVPNPIAMKQTQRAAVLVIKISRYQPAL